MDTRRKRKRKGPGKTQDKTEGVQECSVALENKTASLPVCNPQLVLDSGGPNDGSNISSGNRLVESSIRPSCPSTEPRAFSSCSRLARHRSPSPARISRQREHTEMQVLNERLSSHADHVKQLQAENARLRLQVEAMDNVIERESRNMKKLHGSEIKTLQDLIDTCNEDKSSISSLYEEEKVERERLGAELWDKDVEIASLCEQLDALKTMSESYNTLRVEFDAAEAALRESKQDVERMSAELLKEKRSNGRLEEEARANKERYLKEVEEASLRFSQHMQSADQKLEEGYEKQVTQALASLRQQHIRDLEGLKAEMSSTYQSKMSEWKSACEVAQGDLIAARRDVKVAKQEQDKLRDMTTQLKADKASLEVQLSETMARLEEVRDHAQNDRCQSQREIALLAQELAELKEELEEMGGANSRLEAEINAYRLIVDDLEGQNFDPKTEMMKEDKTNIKTNERKKKRTRANSSPKKVIEEVLTDTFDIYKRKEYLRTNEFSQGIEILDIDMHGRYITLVNTTDHCTDLCLWTVQQTDGQQLVKYEINVSTQMPRGRRLTLWSCDAGSNPTRQGVTHINSSEDDIKGSESGSTRYNKSSDVIVSEDLENKMGLNMTMVSNSWLKLDHTLTVRVEDGDGQLQAKCDISSLTDTGKSRQQMSSAFNPISSSSTGHLASSDTLSQNTYNSSSNYKKRPRLGGFLFPAKNYRAGLSSSETRFNKAASPASKDYVGSSRDGSPSILYPLDKGVKDDTVGGGDTYLTKPVVDQQQFDKDSCAIA